MKESSDFSIVFHIKEHFDDIQNNLKNVNTLEDFVSETERRKAILFDFFQMGELANQLSNEFKTKFNHRGLSLLIAVRNRIVHGYETLEDAIILQTLKSDLPGFVEEMLDFSDKHLFKTLKSLIGKQLRVVFQGGETIQIDNQSYYIGRTEAIRLANDSLQKVCIPNFKYGDDVQLITIKSIQIVNNEYILIGE